MINNTMTKTISTEQRDLINLFKERDEAVKKASSAIFDQISDALSGVNEYLQTIDDSVSNGELSWEDIQMVDENTVMLVGMISFPPGTKFQVEEGNTIEITEANQMYFQKVFKVGLPMEIALDDSKDNVINFLKGTQKFVADSKDEPVIVKDEQPEAEFDLDQLTEQQRLALITQTKSDKLN